MNNEYFVILWAEESLREKRCFQPAPVQSSLPLGQGQSGSCDWESSHWHKSCPLAEHVHEPVQTRLAVAGWVLAMIQAQFPSIKFCCTFLKIKFCLKEILGLRRKASCALEDDQSLGHSYHSCAKSHTFSLTKGGKLTWPSPSNELGLCHTILCFGSCTKAYHCGTTGVPMETKRYPLAWVSQDLECSCIFF